MPLTRAAGAVVLLVVALAVGGCGGSQDAEARESAELFGRLVQEENGAGACALLSPSASAEVEQSAGKPCPEAILAADLPEVGRVVDVDVFGTMAQVRGSSSSLFLSRYGEGWRLVAVGCVPAVRDRYDCQVQG